MKSAQKHTLSKKTIAISSIVAVLLIGTGAMALTHTGPFAQPSDSVSNTSKNSPKANSDNQKTDGPSKDANDGTSEKTPVENEPTESPSVPAALMASITAANQNGNKLQIRTLIETVSSDGTCKLTLTKDSQTHTYSAGVQAQSSTSTCKGFDIPTSDLSAGDWQIAIDINVQGKKAHVTKTVTVY